MPAGMTVTPTVTTGQAATARSANASAGGGQRPGGSAGNERQEAGSRSRSGEITVVRVCPGIRNRWPGAREHWHAALRWSGRWLPQARTGNPSERRRMSKRGGICTRQSEMAIK